MTIKQKRALNNMVKNGGNMGKAMVMAGYSPNTAKTPKKLTSSKGFSQLCEDCGLTEEFLVNSLVNDIKNKEGDRKAELELGFKIKGLLVHKTDISSKSKPISFMAAVTSEQMLEIDSALDSLY